jgi:hypothetical protein
MSDYAQGFNSGELLVNMLYKTAQRCDKLVHKNKNCAACCTIQAAHLLDLAKFYELLNVASMNSPEKLTGNRLIELLINVADLTTNNDSIYFSE